jgi:hypothetical protein
MGAQRVPRDFGTEKHRLLGLGPERVRLWGAGGSPKLIATHD